MKLQHIKQLLEAKGNFPLINTPATQTDLEDMFEYLNKTYFSNQLQKTPIKYAPLAKNYFGKAHVDYTPEGKIKRLLITISAKIKTDAERLVNTLAHEMIHIWQFQMNEKENTRKYTDATWAEIMSSNDRHTWGHNSYFLTEMKRLNTLGLNVDVVGDAPNGIELTKPVFGVLVNENIVLWNPSDPSKYINTILESVKDNIGITVNDYVIFKTLESNITLTTRITKDWKLPKNVLNVKYSKKWIDDLLLDKGVTIIANEKDIVIKDLDNTNEVSSEIKQMLPQIGKWKATSFDSYFKTCWMNAFPELGKIIGRLLYSEGKEFKGAKVPNQISMIEAKFIYDDWVNISDSIIKKSKMFDSFFTDLRFMIMRKASNQNNIDNLISKYEDEFKERVSFDKFKKILSDVIVDKFKKQFKKDGKTFDIEYIKTLNVFFKGTKIDNLF